MTSVREISKWQYVESIFNTINHVLIGFVSIYMTWLCYHNGYSQFTLHVFFCTIGYQLLMAEGILSFYSENSWNKITSRNTKTLLHIVCQVLGSGLAITGISLKIYNTNGRHFRSVHAITGLISMIFVIITCLNGIAALFARRLKIVIRPVYTKFFHNICALFAFVVGMVSLMYGFEKSFVVRVSELSVLLKVFGITTIFITVIGPFKTMYGQFKAMFA